MAIQDGLGRELIDAFSQLPGRKALKFLAPPDAGRPTWTATLDPGSPLFCASAFKGYVLVDLDLFAAGA